MSLKHILALAVTHSILSQAGIHSQEDKTLVKKLRKPSGKRIQETRDSLNLPADTRWNIYYIMLESVNNSREKITIRSKNRTNSETITMKAPADIFVPQSMWSYHVHSQHRRNDIVTIIHIIALHLLDPRDCHDLLYL